jgi:hypothetical protein
MWTFIAMAPDGRELGRESGGRDAEARMRGIVDRFNVHLPRLVQKVAYVKTVPTVFADRFEDEPVVTAPVNPKR